MVGEEMFFPQASDLVSGKSQAYESHETEIALRQKNAEMQAIFDAFPDLFFRLDAQGNILDYKVGRQNTGLYNPPEVFLGKPVRDSLPPAVVDQIEIAIQQTLLTQAIVRFEYSLPMVTGEEFFEARLIPIEPNQIIAAVRTITDRKQAEQALQQLNEKLEERVRQRTQELIQSQAVLRDNEERLRLALIAANQGLYDLNIQTGEAIVTPEYATMLGYDPADFHETNKKWIERLHPDDLERVAGVYQAYVAGEIPDYKVEFRQRTKQGEWKWILSLGKIVAWDEQGQPLRMLGTHTDISDRKRQEEALSQMNLELERRVVERTAELQSAMEMAKAANQAKSTFLANMSHELRTPLNSILGFAQLMSRDRNLPPDKRQQLSIINRSGEHLLNLINDILEMSKIEAGQATLNPNNFDLYDLLDTLEEMFQLRATDKGLRLRFERTSDVPQYIQTDENKLRQVLINLIGNAVKFTDQGQIVLRVSRIKAQQAATNLQEQPGHEPIALHFEVSDTGPGIEPNDIESLFKPFIQARNRQSAQEGTGLGLPISQQFVQLLKGNLTVTSQPGQGATFAFNITAYTAEAANLPTRRSSQQVLSLAPDQPSCRILVVEDHTTSRQLLVQLLRSVGFDVQAAVNGQEAIYLWELWHPQLIWMDMRMPVMNGYEATAWIREQESQRRSKKKDMEIGGSASPELSLPTSSNLDDPPATVIIALTASAFEEERANVLGVGCDDFVRKPFREAALLEKIAEHLGVQYLYAETDKAWDMPEDDQVSTPLEPLLILQSMSTAWIDQLQQALVRLDNSEITALIKQIPSEKATLAKILVEKLDNFDHEEILELVQQVLNNNKSDELT